MKPIKVQSELSDLNIDNVYIYIGDSARRDYLPEGILELGVSVKTLTASTTSAPSFSSLLIGLYPTSRCVYAFKDNLTENIYGMLDVEGYQTALLNSIFEFAERDHERIDPIYPVLEISDPNDIQLFCQIKKPFSYIERGPSGRLTYDYFKKASKHFERNLNSPILREDYGRSIELDQSLSVSA